MPIAQSKTVYRVGESGLPTFNAGGFVSWSTNRGIVSPVNGVSTTLTPINETRLVTISGGGETTSIQIFATFPLQPNYGYDVEVDDKTLISVAEDGSAVFRIKGDAKRTWQLQMPDRPISEYQLLMTFWNYHRKHIEFYYEDLALNELRLVRFDSGVKITPAGPDQISMNCLVREV